MKPPTHFLATERLLPPLPPLKPFTGVPRYRSTVYPKRTSGSSASVEPNPIEIMRNAAAAVKLAEQGQWNRAFDRMNLALNGARKLCNASELSPSL